MTSILGVDPGKTTGYCILTFTRGRYIIIPGQMVGAAGTMYALGELARGVEGVAVEQFVIGRTSQRAGAAGVQTRRVIGHLTERASSLKVPCALRSAADVKPWATDKRLAAMGLDLTGLPHAGDAVRHALFSAVKDFGCPDPLAA